MNRRHFAASLSAVGLLVGCDNDQKPSHTATLLNNSGVQQALKSLEDAIGTLEGDVDRFSGENWREVVPDLQTSATNVRDSFEALRQALQVTDS